MEILGKITLIIAIYIVLVENNYLLNKKFTNYQTLIAIKF